MDRSLDIELSTLADQTKTFIIDAKSKLNLYLNSAYDNHFILVYVKFNQTGLPQGTVNGALTWSEQWHKFENTIWRRAIVFENASAEKITFNATFRIIE